MKINLEWKILHSKTIQSILFISLLPIPHWLLLIPHRLLLISHRLLLIPHRLLLIPHWLTWNHDRLLRCHIWLTWLRIIIRHHLWLYSPRIAHHRLRHLWLIDWHDSLTPHHCSLMHHHVLLHLNGVHLHTPLHHHLLLSYDCLLLCEYISLDCSYLISLSVGSLSSHVLICIVAHAISEVCILNLRFLLF